MENLNVIAVFLLITVGSSMACMYIPRPAQGIIQRMGNEHVPIAFRGKVTSIDHTQRPGHWGFYEATFDVDCVYKSSPEGPEMTKSVTVSRFGDDGAQCVSANVEEDEVYVVLARPYGDGLKVININVQAGVQEVTSHLNERLEKAYVCVAPST